MAYDEKVSFLATHNADPPAVETVEDLLVKTALVERHRIITYLRTKKQGEAAKLVENLPTPEVNIE
ncbi:hypothetical protein GQE99_06535 [Maritimibacter sp. DP07]|uniref:Uncharacterized protein n=1 Tax=Maritimibacter harenae TaxID=2606218 RepID=A0A845LZB5_9RHOB|nr:hypothetical protein [Maritimibacter harenae]MZR12676.1 hypothetical protein [Maritimibacter harenae]